MLKHSKSEGKLSDIKKDDGTDFSSSSDREEYITTYFENVYSLKDNVQQEVGGCIENFLGPEVLNNPIIQNSKLTELEKNSLEGDLSLEELDQSIKQGNNSAAGMDGINNKFLKRFWHHIRTPLHRYALTAFRKGSLTHSFKTASIRLIPKKGDISKLKNWRPISLLSCAYKTLSRALNTKLKKLRIEFTVGGRKALLARAIYRKF
jgi:hypothetical protein